MTGYLAGTHRLSNSPFENGVESPSTESLSIPVEAISGISYATTLPPYIEIASLHRGRDNSRHSHFRRARFLSVHFLLRGQKKVDKIARS